jgi:acetoin utilization deacetylase AcuC-like enzyme
MRIVFSPQCLEFGSPGHPESPERVRTTHELLMQKGYQFVEPSPCTEEDLLLVHTPQLVKSVKNNDFFDWDSPNLPNIYDYAALSVGGALLASEIAQKEGSSFSLMRPPGHHVTRNRLGGFCYFNNVAVAVARGLDYYDKIAILDFDCHHGNGTQDIFLGSNTVLYVSWHQTHIYPGTGYNSQLNCLNFPMPPGSDHDTFMGLFEKGLEKVKTFDPQLIAVSAGFDSYVGDPLTMLRFEKKTYYDIGKAIHQCNIPTFAVLEGGYGAEFPECVLEFLQGYF